MADTYYSDLARAALHKSIGNLQDAQGYLRDAGLPDALPEVDKIIKRIRRMNDTLAKIRPGK